MAYYEKIRALTKAVPAALVDFEQPRDYARTPTQASSNFITNKEQGDWAESLVSRAINESSRGYVAVKYGKSDNLVAGEDGFDAFYQAFQLELDTIGKRPDLLIFNQSDFDADLGFDISHIPHVQITDYVKKAVAGIEVRSSSFLIDTKNQNKTTIKINSKVGLQIASKVEEPIHESVRKEMERGRLLFYVTFKGGTAYLDVEKLETILGIDKNQPR